MKCFTKKVNHALMVGNIHCNTCCEYYPCHYKGQNCSFCYCPFYPCKDTDLGKMISSKYGDIWDCSQCLFNHNNNVVEFSFREFRKLGITSATDPRIRDVFVAAKKNIFRLGKCVMVFGPTSGASAIVAVICRLLLRKCYVITPFKSQSIYNDPRVTRIGHYIPGFQDFQCKAAGLSNVSMDVSPILLKSEDNKNWQVIVNGKNMGKYKVDDNFREFDCELGIDVSKAGIDFLKKRYDYIIMEGSDFPSNMSVCDINKINTEIAKLIDARCILVADIENKNFLGDVLHRIEPILENDRHQVHGIILRILNKDSSGVESMARQLEEITKIPVIGHVSQVSIFSNKSLRCFARTGKKNVYSKKISVIKFPGVAYLSDIDPLYLEGVDIEYITNSQNLTTSDAIVIPDTKNILADLQWLRFTGLFDAIKKIAGRIPIVGICGGFQMMAKCCLNMNDENRVAEGLGLIDVGFRRDENNTHVTTNSSILNLGNGGKVDGYEIRDVFIENCSGSPLFTIKALDRDISEGFADEKRLLYGTYLHGIFEKIAFRQYFISKVYADSVDRSTVDYNDYEEARLDQLADEFFETIDERKFWNIFERN